MNTKQYLFSLIILLFSQTISAEFNIHSDLILHKKPTEWLFAGQIIRENPKHPFEECKQKWQKWLTKTWQTIVEDIGNEVGLSEEQFTSLLFEKEIQSLYHKTKEPRKLTFLKKLSFEAQAITDLIGEHSLAQCDIEFQPEMEYTIITRGLGASHLVQCNSSFFNQQQIEYIVANYLIFATYYSPLDRTDLTSCINVRTLALLMIASAASHINHHKDFFATVMHEFNINQKQCSEETKIRFEQFCHIRCSLEAIFQSENPLEAALFLHSTVVTSSPHEELKLKLWKRVAKDLERCYDPEDLASYQEHIKPHLDQALEQLPFQ
jgi:hypothetical protein